VDRQTRIEENEKLFREVNERVGGLQTSDRESEPVWICECGDETCFEKVRIAPDEYREIRAHEGWFVIKPGHEKPAADRIVRRLGGYVVVEKDVD
jgi:hypothetical protein